MHNKHFMGQFYVYRNYEKEYPNVGNSISTSASSSCTITTTNLPYVYVSPTITGSANIGPSVATGPITQVSIPKPKYRIIKGKKQLSITCSIGTGSGGSGVHTYQEYYYGSYSVLTTYSPSGDIQLASTLICKSLTNTTRWEF